jgi:hypothetical protein
MRWYNLDMRSFFLAVFMLCFAVARPTVQILRRRMACGPWERSMVVWLVNAANDPYRNNLVQGYTRNGEEWLLVANYSVPSECNKANNNNGGAAFSSDQSSLMLWCGGYPFTGLVAVDLATGATRAGPQIDKVEVLDPPVLINVQGRVFMTFTFAKIAVFDAQTLQLVAMVPDWYSGAAPSLFTDDAVVYASDQQRLYCICPMSLKLLANVSLAYPGSQRFSVSPVRSSSWC